MEFNIWENHYLWGDSVIIIEKEGRGKIEIDFDVKYPKRGFINGLTVDPLERRNGLGTALVKEAENVIKERGISYAYLYVDKDKENNVEFWEKNKYFRLEFLEDTENNFYYYLKVL